MPWKASEHRLTTPHGDHPRLVKTGGMKKERATLRETWNETPDAEGTSSPHHPRKRAATERPQHDLRAGYDALGRAVSCAARSGSDGRMHEDAASGIAEKG